MIPHLLWVLLWAGGGSSLSGYLDFEAYLISQDISYTAESLGALLRESHADPAQIEDWVEKLGADTFDERERAGQALAEIGEPARAALVAATRSRDPEISVRASGLLNKLPKIDKELTRINRELALFALGQLRDPASRPLLEQFAEGEASREQWMARQALTAWDRERDDPVPMPESAGIRTAFPGDTAAVARFTVTDSDSPVKAALRQSGQIQTQLRSLFLATGELRFRRITFAVGADSLKNDSPDRAWAAAVIEGEMDPDRLGRWLTAQDFTETGVEGLKGYQRDSLLLVPVNAHMLLALWVKGEAGPEPKTFLAALHGEKSAPGLRAELREQLPARDAAAPVWVRFSAPEGFESELPWLRGVRRAELNGLRQETGGIRFEINGWTSGGAAAEKVPPGVEELAAQRVGRIRNPGHPIMVPVAQFWRSLEMGREAEKVWIRGEITREYFGSLLQQSERARPAPPARPGNLNQFQENFIILGR